MSTVIGIDLGTSTTEAAIFRDGKPEMILNFDGEKVTPSAVGIDSGGNWVAGARAKAQYLLEPENTAIEVKRKMGTGETIRIGKTEYEPAELQIRLLSYVRTYASEYLGENVDRAVISVPAYFDNLQRLETMMAGTGAGFQVERILNEPTAAALCYGLDHLEENSHILVYDLGGGTFDVTLLEMFSGVLEVKASAGDNALGGKDFDERLMNLLLDGFLRKHGKNLRSDRRAMARIREEAERCKIALSEQEEYQVLLPALAVVNGVPAEMNEIVTRNQFEEIVKDLMDRTHAPIDRVLTDAGVSEAQLDQIILVGGSTRMPMVAKDITAFLGKAPKQAVDPDYAVAMGAAIQAGLISDQINPEEGLVMTDVCPYTLGIRTADDGKGNAMSVIIPRNTTIPVTRRETYCTARDRQRAAMIEVYQGESDYATNNHYLGEFLIDGVPPAPAGKEKIDVDFMYDVNGLLKVRATLCSTGKEMAIQVDMKQEKEEKDLSGWKDKPNATAFRTLVRNAEKMISKGQTIPIGKKERLARMVRNLKEALLEEDSEKAAKMEYMIKGLIEEIKEDDDSAV
mgnify:CR=1 FL=1